MIDAPTGKFAPTPAEVLADEAARPGLPSDWAEDEHTARLLHRLCSAGVPQPHDRR